MPKYLIELSDGRKFEVEADKPPSEQDVMAKLGISSAPPNQHTATAEEFAPASQPQGSAMGRFVGGAAEYLNPATIATGLYGAVRHPLDTATAAAGQMGEQWSKAKSLVGQGRYVEAGGHALAGSLPFVGPAAAKAGERIASGDWAGGSGEAFGLLAPTAVPLAVRGATATASKVGRSVPGAVDTVATALESRAASRVTDVMSPKVGANKIRFGNQAAKVAPEIAKDLAADGAPMSRAGLASQVEAKLGEAEAALDTAANARNPNAVIHTAPVVRGLKAKRAEMTAQTHRIGPFKAGADVVPGPNAGRVAQIDRAIEEVEALGPVANYEALRRIRQAYDGPAKAIYSPSMTADYLSAQGSKLGAADVTGVIREQLAQMDPQTAAANATYSVYRTANDVLKAAEETERTRPKVGRAIMARLTAVLIGESAAGATGAVAGYVGGPIIDAALNGGATTQLQTAAMMTKLAQVVRTGDLSAVDGALAKLRAIQMNTRRGGLVGQTTSPTVSPRQTEAPVTP